MSLIREHFPIDASVKVSDAVERLTHIAGKVAVKTKQYCEGWCDSNVSDKYIRFLTCGGLTRPSETISTSIASGFAMLDLTSELIRNSKLLSLFVDGKIHRDFFRGRVFLRL